MLKQVVAAAILTLAAGPCRAGKALSRASITDPSAKTTSASSIRRSGRAAVFQSPTASEIRGWIHSLPLDSLIKEWNSIRWLRALSLTPEQSRIAAIQLRRAGDEGEASGSAIRTARTLISLLTQERDLLASHKPLPGLLMAEIQAQQSAQSFWAARAQRDTESAAQALFFTLSDEQRAVLRAGPDAAVGDTDQAAAMLQRAVGADTRSYLKYRNRIERKYASGAPPIEASLDAARAMKPAEFRKWLPALSERLEQEIAPPASAGRGTDAQVALQLTTLLQSPAVRLTLLSAENTPNASQAAETLLAGQSFEALADQQQRLQQSIQAVNVLQVYGFTPDDIVGGLDELQKADDLRREYETRDRQVQAVRASLAAALDRLAGRTPHASPAANPAMVEQGIRANQLNVSADLQLAAMAMLGAMPPRQLDAIAADTTLPYRYVRALQALSSVRNQPLPQYVVAEASDIRQVEAIAEKGSTPAVDTLIRKMLRGVRMMTDAEYGARVEGLARRIATLAHPLPAAATIRPAAAPAAPATSANATAQAASKSDSSSPADDPLSPESEKQQLILNAAARRLASFLNVPDLWRVLWRATPHR